MNKQEQINIDPFMVDLAKVSQCVYLACDAEVAADISLKINKAIKLVDALQDQLKWAYCEKIGSDSVIGLDSCDDYKDWLSSLGR